MPSFSKGRRISNIVVDADLDMGAYDLKTDDILESTASAGVTVDGVNMKDSNIELNSGSLKTTNILLKEIDADTMAFKNHAEDAAKKLYISYLTSEAAVKTGSFMEYASGVGITVDGVLLKDGNVDAVGIKECNVTTDTPGTPTEGDIKWDSTAHKLQVYSGTAWETVTSAE